MMMFSRVWTVVLRTSARLLEPRLWILSNRISHIFSKFMALAFYWTSGMLESGALWLL